MDKSSAFFLILATLIYLCGGSATLFLWFFVRKNMKKQHGPFYCGWVEKDFDLEGAVFLTFWGWVIAIWYLIPISISFKIKDNSKI